MIEIQMALILRHDRIDKQFRENWKSFFGGLSLLLHVICLSNSANTNCGAVYFHFILKY